MEQAIFIKKEQHFLSGELSFDFCGFSKTLPFHSFGPAIRSSYILHIVLQGKGTYHVGNQQFRLKKGDLFLIRPGESTFYRSDPDDPWVYGWMSFGGRAAEDIIQQSVFQDDYYTVVSTHVNEYIQLISDTFHYMQETLLNELKLNGILLRFLELLLTEGGERILAAQKHGSRLANDAIVFIREHFTEDITIQDIADQLAVNRSHLSRVFHESFGMSMKEWLIGIRINRAAFLLSMTDDTVESIAYQSGFHSLIVFSRSFKKMTGETPTGYRKRMAAESVDPDPEADILALLEQQEIVSRAT